MSNPNNNLLREQALNGLQDGKITQFEYEVYIQSLNREESSKKKKIAFTVLLVAMLGIFASVVIMNPSSIGFATFDVPVQNYTGNVTIHATQEFISMKISGTLFGDGTASIYYKTNNSNLLVGTINSNDGSPYTTKASYLAGEEVTIENTPTTYNAYLDDGTNNIQTLIPFAAPSSDMTLLIVANNSDVLTTYRLPIIIGVRDRITTFANLCVDTCTMPASSGDLVIETTGSTQLSFNNIETTLVENTAPVLTTPIDDITTNTTTTIDLAMHFNDANGDTLYYSIESTTFATTTIDGNILTITPIEDGTQTLNIYASDLKDIATDSFQLTIAGMIVPKNTTNTTTENNVTINETINTTTNTTLINETTNTSNSINDTNTTLSDTNSTLNDTNITTNDTNYTTNTTINTTLDCSNPDPNARPLDCVLDTTYFKPESIYIDNKDSNRVAMLTPIGNLLIKGDVVQHSTAMPAINDYQLGHRNNEGDFVPMIWINSQTGDLHLRGTLVEANGQLPYQEGYTSYSNQRGIILALANLETGDFILRGGIIPYRRVIE